MSHLANLRQYLLYFLLFICLGLQAQAPTTPTPVNGIKVDRIEPSATPNSVLMSSSVPDASGKYKLGFRNLPNGTTYNIITVGDTSSIPSPECNSYAIVKQGDSCLNFVLIRNCALSRWDTLVYALHRNCANGGGSAGIFTVQNGLTQSGSVGELGGPLLHSTQINGKDLYNFELRDIKRYAVINNTGKVAYTFSLANDAGALNFLRVQDTIIGQTNLLNLDPTYGFILSATKGLKSSSIQITPDIINVASDTQAVLSAKKELNLKTPLLNNNPSSLKRDYVLTLMDTITGRCEYKPIPNSVIDNILSSSGNIITSNINGSVDTTLIIRSLAMSMVGNSLTVSVNGVNQSVTLPVGSGGITTNVINSNGNIITSTVNGVTDTTLSVRTVSTGVSGTTLTVSVNGISSSVNMPSGDNWGAQVVQRDATLAGQGITGNLLKIAQQGATVGQTLKWNGTTWFPANDLDNDAQTLNLTGNTLSISNGNSVTLPSTGGGGGGTDNWGTQVVQKDATLAGTGVTGNLLKIAQQGATVGQTLKWSGSTWLPGNDLDAQTLSLVGNSLSISNGNSITLPSAGSSPDITVTDSPTIDLTASGSANHQVTASAKISSTAGNQLQSLADGLYVTGSGSGGGGTNTTSNGISLVGSDIRLGGTLTNALTTIDGLNSKSVIWKDLTNYKIANSIGTVTTSDEISASGMNRQIINTITNQTGWHYNQPNLNQIAIGTKTGPTSFNATNFVLLDGTGSTNGVRMSSQNLDVRIDAAVGKIVSEASAGQNHVRGKTGIFFKTPQVYNAPGSLLGGYVFTLIDPTTGQGEWQPAPAGTTYTNGPGIGISGTVISNTGDLSNTNELQTISKTGSTINLSNGGGSVNDSDNQTLSLSGNNLTINNGNTIGLPVHPDNAVTDSPTIDLSTSGANNSNITASVKISATAGNIITSNADGLFATGGCGSSYSSNNGLTTTGTVHQLGGNLVQSTLLSGVNSFGLSLDNLPNFRIRNITAGNSIKPWLSMDNSLSNSNFWQVTHGITNNNTKLTLSPSSDATLGYYTSAGGNSRIGAYATGLGIESTLGDITIESTNNTTKVQGKTGIEVKTPAIYGATATVGQVLTLTNAATGKAEWQTPTGGSSNTYQNGLTKIGSTVEFGGTLLHDTQIDQNGKNMNWNGNYPRKGYNGFFIDSVGLYFAKVTVTGAPTASTYHELSTRSALTEISENSATLGNYSVKNLIIDQGHQITSSNATYNKTSALIVQNATNVTPAEVRMASYNTSSGSNSGCDWMVQPLGHFQKNMSVGYTGQNVLNTRENNGDGTDKRVTQGMSMAGIGAVLTTFQSVVNTAITVGFVMHTNLSPATNNLPNAATSLNKVLEIRAFGTAPVTLNPAPLLNTSGTTLTTLQPFGSNSYGSPTYLKIYSDGSNWLVMNMW